MMTIRLLCFVALVALIGSGVDATCGSTLSTYLPQNDVITTTLYVESPYSVTVINGIEFAVIWNGTDAGKVDKLDLTGQMANMTLIDATIVEAGRPPRPVIKVSTADRTKSALSICTIILGLGALFCLRKGLSSSTMLVALFALSMATLISSTILSSAPCPDATVTLQIPEGNIRFVYINSSPYVCGPGYSGDNCEPDSAPVSTPISTPVDSPIATPIAAPVATPVNPPVNPPTNPPVNPPVSPPTAPIAPPVAPPVGPSCNDAIKNGAETDIDCGGGTCNKCAPLKKCLIGFDCSSGVCLNTVCQQPSCNDGVQNAAETDIDCGGGTCNKCAATKKCSVANDCIPGVCTANVCQQPACNDGIKNGAETDIDCGGGTCNKCADTKTCSVGTDCTGGVCLSNTCRQPACNDALKNGLETDVDCGGGTCPKCAATKRCAVANDCATGVCTNNFCQQPACDDTVMNGAETDVDCGGGTCNKCAATKGCAVANDCTTGVCTSNVCQQAKCDDTVKNGAETDVDCGGGTCSKCANGKACAASADCQSNNCNNNVCAAPTTPCTNGVQDDVETDVDCGGGDCPKCADGKGCMLPDDCTSNHCYNIDISGFCSPTRCYDRVQNGGESDVDCGGSSSLCRRCNSGEKCTTNGDCRQDQDLYCNTDASVCDSIPP